MICHEIMGDKLWQEICMYIFKDMLVVMGPFTYTREGKFKLRSSLDVWEIPCVSVTSHYKMGRNAINTSISWMSLFNMFEYLTLIFSISKMVCVNRKILQGNVHMDVTIGRYSQFSLHTRHYNGLCYTQRAHDAIITSLRRQTDVATSFWCHNDRCYYCVVCPLGYDCHLNVLRHL